MEETESPAIVLTPVEARLVACLVEKEIATPEQYPLSLNALKSACNQKSNRNPVMSLDEQAIEEALTELRYRHQLAWQVETAGSRVPKYKHRIGEVFRFNPPELAVLCELMLRGPQTIGELRSHASRLHPLDSTDDVVRALEALADWAGHKLVVRVPPGPGRREQRYAHLLCGEAELPAQESEPHAAPAPRRPPPDAGRLDAIERELAALREEFEAFRKQFDG